MGARMKKLNVFFETFRGEYIQIVQDFEITMQMAISEDQAQEVRMPMTVTGFLMDHADGFLYLSPDGININQALPFESVKHVEILEVKDELAEALDEIPEPEDKSGYN